MSRWKGHAFYPLKQLAKRPHWLQKSRHFSGSSLFIVQPSEHVSEEQKQRAQQSPVLFSLFNKDVLSCLLKKKNIFSIIKLKGTAVSSQALMQTVMAQRRQYKLRHILSLSTHEHAPVHWNCPTHTFYTDGSSRWRLSSIKGYCLSSLDSLNPLVSAVYSPGRSSALPV